MNEPENQFRDLPEPAAPRALAEGLQGIFARPLAVPAAVDRAVLAMARGRLSRRRRPAAIIRRLVAGGAAAAAALALLLLWHGRGPAEDLDRNGRVDILDAFLLARRLEAGEVRRAWDVNQDGAVDRLDVDAIALRAVRVE